MIYTVNYQSLASKVNPFAMVKYLRTTGWIEFPVKRNNIKVFQKNTDRLYQVTVPLDIYLSDYTDAMFECIKEISSEEKHAIEKTLLHLLNPASDILRVRVKNEGIENGNILIDDAVNLFDNTKKLLLSAAQDILNPASIHQGRPDSRAAKFVSECRFGQTEIGSYVISVICPFTELQANGDFEQMSFLSDDELVKDSITRKVTKRIVDNISTIKTGISTGDDSKLIEKKDSISANFYDALAGIGISSENTTVEFNVDWSPILKDKSLINSSISIDHNYYDEIRHISSRIKKSKPEARSVIGKVVELKSDQDVEQRHAGTVRIIYLDDENNRKSSVVVLEKNNYNKAIDAHKDGYYVKASLIPTKQANRFTCENFVLLDSEQ